MEYKKYNKLGNRTKRSRLTNMKDKLMIISGGGEEGRRSRVEDEKKSHMWNFWKLKSTIEFIESFINKEKRKPVSSVLFIFYWEITHVQWNAYISSVLLNGILHMWTSIWIPTRLRYRTHSWHLRKNLCSPSQAKASVFRCNHYSGSSHHRLLLPVDELHVSGIIQCGLTLLGLVSFV